MEFSFKPRRSHRSGRGSGNRQGNSQVQVVLYGLVAVAFATYFLWVQVLPEGMPWYGRLFLVIVVDILLLTIVSWAITADLLARLAREARLIIESNNKTRAFMHREEQKTQRALLTAQTRVAMAQLSSQRSRQVLERQVAWSQINLDKKLLQREAKMLPPPVVEDDDDPYDADFRVVK